MWSVLLLLGCHGLTETGDAGMVGRLVDAAGNPVVDQVIRSIEGQGRTDADGFFAVPWKPPETLVMFERHGINWQLGRAESHRGTQVVIALPQTRAVTVECPPISCNLTFEWALEDGLKGRWSSPCEPEATFAVGGAPSSRPIMLCGGNGVPAMQLDDRGSVLAVQRKPVPLRIRLVVAEEQAPEACEVRHGEVPATGQGAGWVAMVNRDAWLIVVCDGRPALPQRVPMTAGSAAVEWTDQGPHLDLQGQLPGVWTVQLTSETSPPWTMSLVMDETGSLPLPPLPRGTYQIEAVTEGPQGQLRRVGMLQLQADHTTGRIPVELLSAEP